MMKMVVIMVSISLAMSGSQPLAVAGDSPLLIGLFDSSQLSGQSNVLMKPLAKALRDRGYKTIALIPQRAKDPQQITRSRLDVLIYLGADHTIAMGQRCIEYLKEGGRFWFIGDAGPFTGSVFTAVDSSDQFIFSNGISDTSRSASCRPCGESQCRKDPRIQIFNATDPSGQHVYLAFNSLRKDH